MRHWGWACIVGLAGTLCSRVSWAQTREDTLPAPNQRRPSALVEPAIDPFSPAGPSRLGGQRQRAVPESRPEPAEKLRDVSFERVFAPFPRLRDAAVEDRRADPDAAADGVGHGGDLTHRDPYWGRPPSQTAHWVAPNLLHRTLYFEDNRLERWGLSHGPVLQPICSGLRFFSDAVMTPFRTPYEPEYVVEYVLGFPRAGSPPESARRSATVGR